MLLKEIEGREPVFSPHFWNQISLWSLSYSLFIPDRIDCFSSLFVPTSLSVDRDDHLTCFFWYLIFPFITLAWSLNGVILIATCYLLPSTPFTLAKVKFLKCLIQSPNYFWSFPYTKVVSQHSGDNHCIPWPLWFSAWKPDYATDLNLVGKPSLLPATLIFSSPLQPLASISTGYRTGVKGRSVINSNYFTSPALATMAYYPPRETKVSKD